MEIIKKIILIKIAAIIFLVIEAPKTTSKLSPADQYIMNKIAIEKQLRQLIESIPDIQRADVTVALPDYSTGQELAVDVILIANPSSSLLSEKLKILDIQNLILSSTEDLKEENLVICDSKGNWINNFEEMTLSDTECISCYE